MYTKGTSYNGNEKLVIHMRNSLYTWPTEFSIENFP